MIAGLLAAEMTARSGADPGELVVRLTERYGPSAYRRIDVPATAREKALLGALSREQVRTAELAGEPILDVLTTAPGNGAPIGGVKVVAENGWFAARPSGTEDIYKIYGESLVGPEHLERVLAEARTIVSAALDA
jgi:phosphoglucomutase